MIDDAVATPPWLRPLVEGLDEQHARDQLPHAVLIYGPVGTGRRYLAACVASRVLGLDPPALGVGSGESGGFEPDMLPGHPDLRVVGPPPDRRVLPIDRMRELIAFLQLTSHQRGAKVGLVAPAEAMSHGAANSVLKTLEEPPRGSLMVLVADAVGRLPATVVSRCRRVRVAAPSPDVARAWLDDREPGRDWSLALAAAGGAPLRALALAHAGLVDEVARLEREWRELRAGRTTPASLARRWAGLPAGLCLDWLYRRTGKEIRAALESAPKTPTGTLQNAAGTLNIRAMFDSLDEVAALRRLAGSGLNTELGLARVLGSWCE